jgi:transcriptional regulator with XRE-family HTH domain
MRGKPSPLSERLGAIVRERRLALGLSLRALADQVGIAFTHLWAIEHGVAEPGAAILARLCLALEVSADRLLGLNDE